MPSITSFTCFGSAGRCSSGVFYLLLLLLVATGCQTSESSDSSKARQQREAEESAGKEPAKTSNTGKEKTGKEKTGKEKTGKETHHEEAALDGATGTEALLKVLPPTPHQLPAPLSSLDLGSTALSQVDDGWQQRGTDWEELPGAKLAVDSLANRHPGREGLANLVRLELPKDVDLDSLKKRWGESVPGPDNSGVIVNGVPLAAHYWFDPEKGVRTKLLESIPAVTWTRYTPWRTLVPADETPSPILSPGVFQTAPAALAERLSAAVVEPEAKPDTDKTPKKVRKGRFTLFSTEYGHLPIVIDVWPDKDGKIGRIAVFVEFGNFVAGRAQMVAFLTALHENHGMPSPTEKLGNQMGTPGGVDAGKTGPENSGDGNAAGESPPQEPALRPTNKPPISVKWEHDGVRYELQRSESVGAAWRLSAKPIP